MRDCIHRGAKQFGGTCIEVETDGQQIALDVGLPLDAADIASLLPAVPNFRDPDDSLSVFVISHSYQEPQRPLLPPFRRQTVPHMVEKRL